MRKQKQMKRRRKKQAPEAQSSEEIEDEQKLHKIDTRPSCPSHCTEKIDVVHKREKIFFVRPTLDKTEGEHNTEEHGPFREFNESSSSKAAPSASPEAAPSALMTEIN